MFTSLSQINISGVVAIVIATPLLGFTIYNIILSKASKKWPKVVGTILTKHKQNSRRKSRLEYEYVASGNSYKSSRIFYSNTANYSNKLASEFDKKYTEHQIVDVYYNPSNPSQSVLQPGRTDGAFLGVGIFGVMWLFGVLAVFEPTLFVQLIDTLFQLLN